MPVRVVKIDARWIALAAMDFNARIRQRFPRPL
jgi:hypothetical protein